ncbi:MAG: bile acid:sodium symporter, partial [Mariniphaga sp.]|nr:bile acid:sodium symporter [Mariniphaga sp.]
MKRFFGDWFITCLFLMILAAWIKPGIGMDLNYIDLNLVINIGVILIFFFYGLKLDWVKMKAGMRNWKMHFAVQLTTFLLFPLLILPF